MAQRTDEKTLFQVETGTELINSLNLAFEELVCSDKFAVMERPDREKILFHWELLRDFLNSKN